MPINKKKPALSFPFSWDSNKAGKGRGKVLGKRKMKPSESSSTTAKSPTKSPKITVVSSVTIPKPNPKPVETTVNLTKSPQKTPEPPQKEVISNLSSPEIVGDKSIGHIKRKQRKDKLLARKLLQEGGGSGDVKSGKDKQNYNLFSVRHKDIYVNTSAGSSVSEKVFTQSSFKDMEIHPYVVSNLEKHGFLMATNVQSKVIPVIGSGKNTLVRSQTGSGKTLAYAVPIIDALQGIQPKLKRSDGIQAMIVVPTRELALQVHELFRKINSFQWLVVGLLCGGENRKSEKERIRKGMSVVIGTPGRLLDHVLHTTTMKLDTVRCLVLDEADRLLDMGFRRDIVRLVYSLDEAKSNSEMFKSKDEDDSEDNEEENVEEDNEEVSVEEDNEEESVEEETVEDDSEEESVEEDNEEESVEEDNEEEEMKEMPLKDRSSKSLQNVMLSATLTHAVSELASFMMKDHTYIDVLDLKSNAVADSYVIPHTVQQEFIITHAKHRLFTLAALLLSKASAERCKVFVFMASTQMVDYHYDLFRHHLVKMPVNRGRPNEDATEDDEEEEVMDTQFFKLHGSMDQSERKAVFKGFLEAVKGILICTDVVARGIDVPTADCIIQYTGPQMDEDYLHRVGRTGRAGQSGSAILFLTHEEQEYIDHLRTHRVFLKKRDPEEYLKNLTVVMEEPNVEEAATRLQRHLEAAVERDSALGKSACFAYSTWSRFYNAYPVKMRKFFDFKRANLGHYVTSFALRLTPTQVARVVRGEVGDVVAPRLNKKLANHSDNPELARRRSLHGQQKVGKLAGKTVSLSTSEFSSGLEPLRKRNKQQE